MRLLIYQPDIPQNTGAMLRTAACLGVGVDIVGPTAFDVSDRALRRAGLDYIPHVAFTRHASWDQFLSVHRANREAGRLILLTTSGNQSLYDFSFRGTDVLIVGRESAGVPAHVHDVSDARLRLPMIQGMRSLNVSVSAAIALAEALRQTGRLP
ncbi:MAG: tRNA (cytidine(34)-2'-O)-methyltransferase [Hyphomicrobiaceae bacterium]